MTARNFELQRGYLQGRQREISLRLFGKGVVSRLVETQEASGAGNSLQGLNQLDKLFVPHLDVVRDDQRAEKVLSLAAITYEGQEQRAFTYIGVGMLGAADILHPFHGVGPEDAQAVYDAAHGLIEAKNEGILPNLDPSLICVQDPSV